MRVRVQAAVDRRFYRHKHDVARTLQTFGALLCSVVDLAQLSQRLPGVVDDPMHPAHACLWLARPHFITKPQPASEPATRIDEWGAMRRP